MQVIQDPEEIDDFARTLSRFSKDLSSMMSSMNGQFSKLGDTWRDPAFARFAQDYQSAMAALQQFLREADDQVPRLHMRAEKGRELRDMR